TAIYTFPGGGTPWIVVSDGLWDLVGFTFSPTKGFFEGFRAHDEHWQLAATPMAMPDTETFAPEAEAIVDWRGQAIKKPPRTTLDFRTITSPSRTAEDNIVFMAASAMHVRQPTGMVID